MNEEPIKFSWVNTHKQIVKFLAENKDNQLYLIKLLKDLGITGFNDRDEAGNVFELTEIDPFTFFCCIYKHGASKRLSYLQKIAEKIGISELPSDESGIPSANPQSTWLFPYKVYRVNNEIERLWNLFFKVLDGGIDNKLFEDALQIGGTGKTKLTEALFYIDPIKYFPINAPARLFLKEVLGTNPSFKTYTEYLKILEQIKQKTSKPFYELSSEAYVWNNSRKKVSYWIFQGSPKMFDFETALKENLIEDWNVAAHKENIKPGDKVIIWITGKQPGCYALAEVTHEPQLITQLKDSHLWKEGNPHDLQAGIKITHNLLDKPILKEQIATVPELAKLKVSNQGTNFSATEEEFMAILEMAEPSKSIKYWLYAPGENARWWDEFYSLGIMGLGWDKLGDLNNYANKKEIVKMLQALDGTTGSKKNDATANFEFKDVISVGDIVIAKKGRNELLGYGIVTSGYYYDSSRDSYQKCRKVDWKKWGKWDAQHHMALKTLTDITKYPSEHPQHQFYYEWLLGIMEANHTNEDVIEADTPFLPLIDLPLNTILYGPPGTGKTHRLKNEYFKLFTDEQSTQTLEEYCLELVKDLAWWEVISVIMLDLKSTSVERIFEHPLLKAKNSISVNKTPKNTIWSLLQWHTKKDCPHVNFTKRATPLFFWKDDKGNWTIDEEIAQLETPDFYEVLKKYRNYAPISKTERRYVFTTFHQSFSYEDFIEGIKPKLTKPEEDSESADVQYHVEKGVFKEIVDKATANSGKRFAIFIDEINRGNIANIFGELITLIEDDKRIGCANYIPAMLPYSKKEFGVPNNLHIIGTMNTADRSVEALDTALRRRFSFIEMSPEPQKLAEPEFKCEGIELNRLLEAINCRIEKLLDKDYCIGHSYFMSITNQQSPFEELKLIFLNKILPLLQEYFYGDWGKIMLVLGKGFVKKKVEAVKFLATDEYEEYEEFDSKPTYSFTDAASWSLNTFKGVYE
ncbi:EVE domain-containing protein [Pontibacter diazotrophicus]|uniref:EVE domain-containing protein n=1 Tax=Pontibacter diazotrophicus TaxID=1400979 RepID=A0A3D8LIC8_9BACT|nr:AAA family ATPase [Pontibacter diazotrophicus]RDV17203.1 EVE domain-containing protein [Pontibacter diazotrophicus]